MTPLSSGWKVLMGGSGAEGMDRSIMSRFVELAGGAVDARVAIVPTASEQRADTIERYENAFELEDVHHIEVIDIRTHHQADQPEALNALEGRHGRHVHRRRPAAPAVDPRGHAIRGRTATPQP